VIDYQYNQEIVQKVSFQLKTSLLIDKVFL